ncbi:hypothetical protein Tco_0738897 [Tanacetum coccineum]
MGKVVMVSAVTAATVVEVVWVGGDEGGGMMMVAVDLWWGRGLGWRGVDASRMMAAMVMNKVSGKTGKLSGMCACCKIFGHVRDEYPKNIDLDVVKNMKKPSHATRDVPKDVKPTTEVSNSKPFDVLNSVENDVDLGTNGGTSNLASKKVNSNGSSFWNVKSSNNEGKPLTKVDSSGDHDSDDEVASTDNDMANFLASTKVGYGTNSLMEQWKESYEYDDYDFDPYDDDMYEGHDIPDKIQAICDNLDIKVQGRKKK